MKRFSRLLCLILSGLLAVPPLFGAQFFLAPHGDDSHDGTRQAPWKTFERACEAIRQLRRTAPAEAITLFLAGGRYELTTPWIVTAQECGEGPLVIAALPGENPRLCGSRPLLRWEKVTDPTIRKRLDPSVREQVYQSDITAAGILGTGDPVATGKRPALYCQGEQQTLARWPNTGFVHAGRAIGTTPVPENWAGFQGTIEGKFTYTDPHQNQWAQEADIRLNGYWFWDWKDDYQQVRILDTLHRTITLEGAPHTYGYKDSLRYRGLNLLCELDAPGEWYLDRQTNLLYWYPADERQLTDPVSLSRFDAPYMIELRDCRHVTLRGVWLEESRGSGIYIENGEQCRIEQCRLNGMGEDGIRINGGLRHSISECQLRQLGCSGIQLRGGDRKTLTPAGHRVENCVIENFSLFHRTYQPAVHAEGCGFYIGHNRFEHSSSSAVRYEGNEMLFEYNIVRDVVNESDDQGGIESFFNPTYRGITVRYNLWENIQGGTFSGACGVRMDDMICGMELYGNIFVRCGSFSFGGVQINGGKENRIENNLFVHCPAAVSLTSMWTPEKWIAYLDTVSTVQQKLYEEVDINSEIYRTRYPELQHLRTAFNRNTIRNNLLVDTPRLLMTGEDGNELNNARQQLENNTQLYETGKTLEQLCKASFLQRYGLSPLPLKEMGPRNGSLRF